MANQLSTGPIYWGSYTGDMLEMVMAVFLAQECPDVLRRTPASGDGGIDLIIPLDDGRVDVWQVKGFCGRLDASRKAQIKASYTEIQNNPRLDRAIRDIYVVIPVDLTPDEDTWFVGLVKKSKYPCRWRGLPFWNNLASKHPHVLDYYFNGGRDRIIERQRALDLAVNDPTQPLSIDRVVAALRAMTERLTADDPHYRYDLHVTASEPSAAELQKYMLAQVRATDSSFLAIGVLAKHDYAEADAPILAKMVISPPVAQRNEFDRAWEGFVKFGRPLEIPDGSLAAHINAPGGLSCDVIGGSGRFGPALGVLPDTVWKLVLVDEADTVLVELPVDTISVTHGHAGGTEVTMRDPSGVITAALALMPPTDGSRGTSNLSFRFGEVVGEPVAKVASALRFLSNLRSPNVLEIRERYGGKPLTSLGVGESMEPPISMEFVAYADDLLYVQRSTHSPLVVESEVTREFAEALSRHVRMLRGEVIRGTWTTVSLALAADADLASVANEFADSGVLEMERHFEIQFDNGTVVDLGPFVTALSEVRLPVDAFCDPGVLRLEPGDDATWTQRCGALKRGR